MTDNGPKQPRSARSVSYSEKSTCVNSSMVCTVCLSFVTLGGMSRKSYQVGKTDNRLWEKEGFSIQLVVTDIFWEQGKKKKKPGYQSVIQTMASINKPTTTLDVSMGDTRLMRVAFRSGRRMAENGGEGGICRCPSVSAAMANM